MRLEIRRSGAITRRRAIALCALYGADFVKGLIDYSFTSVSLFDLELTRRLRAEISALAISSDTTLIGNPTPLSFASSIKSCGSFAQVRCA